ncbi:MAG: aminotransferase class I/II-fold pyridoxal phosphate-dependent enzyme, partial [Candidatus Neomarinimicrobiota bacterium]
MFKKIIPAQRTQKVTYAIRDIVIKAKQLEARGQKIIYLNIGDPPVYDFETPRALRQIVIDKILHANANVKSNVSTYADSLGIAEAREAVAHYAVEKKGIKGITAENVFIANGASEAITLAIAALIDPGDNIMTPSPGYPLYSGQIPVYH